MDNRALLPSLHPVDQLELAICVFERVSGLSVSIHHLDRAIWPLLPLWRFIHTSAACLMAKAEDHDACQHFDRRLVHERLEADPHGFVKICPAGLVEWVVPVGPPANPLLILFAGQGVPGKGLDALAPLKSEVFLHRPRITRQSLHGTVDAENARHLLELLQQLGARIDDLLQGARLPLRNYRLPLRESDRRRSIEFFIQHNHLQPIHVKDLADYLRLSTSRTVRIIKQAFGRSFVQLLNAMRIRTAANLLEHTELSVLEVALHSGFQELSSFHRQFRRITGRTPLQHRAARHAGPSVVPLSISMARGIVSADNAREQADP